MLYLEYFNRNLKWLILFTNRKSLKSNTTVTKCDKPNIRAAHLVTSLFDKMTLFQTNDYFRTNKEAL